MPGFAIPLGDYGTGLHQAVASFFSIAMIWG
jgi:hypothetical protein